MDDCLLYGPTWALMVAGMDLRLDWVRLRRAFHRHECTPRRCIPHHLPRRRAHKLWRVWEPVVHFQSWSDGMVRGLPAFLPDSVIYPYFACAMQCVVRRAGKYWWRLCEGPPSRNVAQRQ